MRYSSFLRYTLGLVGVVVLAGGCHLVAPLDESKIERTEQKTYSWNQESPVQGIDVLIVVDTTDATRLAPLIGPLTAWIRSLANQAMPVGNTREEDGGGGPEMYDQYYSGMPSIHVGFVTSDMGAGTGDATVAECTQSGDRGRLIPARVDPGLDGRFLHSFLIIDGENVRNWRDASGIEEQLSLDDGMRMFWDGVLARSSSCPFQQPLGATIAAVDMNLNMENLGFVRYNAALGLLMLGQQDDCTANDSMVYSTSSDPYDMGIDMGPLSTFRCFEYGVTCDSPETIRSPGIKTRCTDLPERVDGYGEELPDPTGLDLLPPGIELFKPAAHYAQSLVALKGDFPVVIGSIGGLTDTIEVVDQGGPRLQPAQDCQGQPLNPLPSVRLKAFADALGGDMFSSLCNVDIEMMYRFNHQYQNQAMTRCFTEEVLDGNPETPEIDADCIVEFVNDPGTVDEAIVASPPSCIGAQGWEEACWEIKPVNPECGGLPSLDIRAAWGGDAPPIASDTVRARCTVERL